MAISFWLHAETLAFLLAVSTLFGSDWAGLASKCLPQHRNGHSWQNHDLCDGFSAFDRRGQGKNGYF
jgi:hypothetical protein